MTRSLLYAFPAGRLHRVRGTRRVRADGRKGTVRFELEDEDGVDMVYISWRERQALEVEEEEYIVMPEETVWEEAVQGGRAYLLRWTDTPKKVFFWFQDKDRARVQGHIRRVREILRDPSGAAGVGGGSAGNGASANDAATAPQPTRAFPDAQALATAQGGVGGNRVDNDELQSGIDLLRSLQAGRGGAGLANDPGNEAHVDLLRRMLDQDRSGTATGNGAPTSADDANRAATSGVASTSEETSGRGASTVPGIGTEALPSAGQGHGPGPLTSQGAATSGADGDSERERQLAQMNRLLSTMTVPPPPSSSSDEDVSLLDVLSPSQLVHLINDPQIRASLFPHLPTSSQQSIVSGRSSDTDELRNLTSSPPFRSSIRTLQHALETGQLGPMMQSLGLPAEAGSSVGAFLRAMGDRLGRDRNDMDTT